MNDDNDYINHGIPDDAPETSIDEAGDAELDALLLRFGADYNRPSDIVPREEIWHEIRRRGSQQPTERRRSVISLLAAAAVLLAAGIGIGVEAHSRIVSRSNPLGTTSPVAQATPVSRGVIASTTPTGINGDTDNASKDARVLRTPTVVQGVNTRESYANNDAGAESNDASRSTAYSLATVRHFTAVEALLTSYQTSSHDARGDAQMAAWARSLLSQTRLLLDSPAAKDPARNQLLQDLELILVQMTQLSPADTPIDRQIMDGSVNHSDVITRLRTAVPAGASTTL